MARTIQLEVFTFDELSDKAKEKARQWWRDTTSEFGYAHADEAITSLKDFIDEFGGVLIDYEISSHASVKINFDSFGQGKIELSGKRLLAYLWNHHRNILYTRKPYGKYQQRANGEWEYDRYSKCQLVQNDCPFTGVTTDEDLLDPMRKYMETPDMGLTLEELLTQCLSSWATAVGKQCEYEDSDEGVDEAIIGNEYEFTSNGLLFHAPHYQPAS